MVAEQSGAKSQLAGIVGAGVVVLLLVFFNGLLADLPNSALAAVVIAGGTVALRFRPARPGCGGSDAPRWTLAVASAGVIFFGVLEGIVVAVVLSILLFFERNWWPHGEVLGRASGRDGWHSDAGWRRPGGVPDVVVFRWEAPLFFANSGLFAEQVRELVQERELRWVVLQCEAITDIDVTVAGMLERLDDELNANGRPPCLRRATHRSVTLSRIRTLQDPRPTTSTARLMKPSPTSADPRRTEARAVRCRSQLPATAHGSTQTRCQSGVGLGGSAAGAGRWRLSRPACRQWRDSSERSDALSNWSSCAGR